ncbi:histidine phosphatase family protein [Streptomyces sp. NPDC048295]|uniref:histidine phosphatase family protein n=1 Tax=Streptomyces sp. NPDC048295 TaxID=3154617 RepID=UPI003431BC17
MRVIRPPKSRLAPGGRCSIDAIYSSPAKRCVQTVEPLARSFGLSIATAPGLATPDGTYQPREWTEGFFSPFQRELGGAWMAGAALAVLIAMGKTHPGGHVVACSHGDVVPVIVAQALALYGHTSPPPVVDRGGWHRMRFGTDELTVQSLGPVVSLPSMRACSYTSARCRSTSLGAPRSTETSAPVFAS